MKKWTLVDQSLTPDGATVALYEQDGSYTIRVDHVTLMSTRQHGSEEKLAELGCAHLRSRAGARVLIGGLGFGFTLRAALRLVAADAEVTVAELLSPVIAWNREPSLPLAASAMADARVRVLHRDVVEVIREARGAFDSILLDVDNGPAAFTTPGNARLYDPQGLRAVVRALRPGGCAAFWSAAADPKFERSMREVGFAVDVQRSRAYGNSGRHHTVFVGRVLP